MHRLAGLLPETAGKALLSRYRFVGAAGIHPAWFPGFSMRLAAALHRRRGGRVLTMFLHSSELFPGGSPQFPDAAAVDRLVAKLRDFLSWLVKRGPVTGLTLSGLYDSWLQLLKKPKDAVTLSRAREPAPTEVASLPAS